MQPTDNAAVTRLEAAHAVLLAYRTQREGELAEIDREALEAVPYMTADIATAALAEAAALDLVDNGNREARLRARTAPPAEPATESARLVAAILETDSRLAAVERLLGIARAIRAACTDQEKNKGAT